MIISTFGYTTAILDSSLLNVKNTLLCIRRWKKILLSRVREVNSSVTDAESITAFIVSIDASNAWVKFYIFLRLLSQSSWNSFNNNLIDLFFVICSSWLQKKMNRVVLFRSSYNFSLWLKTRSKGEKLNHWINVEIIESTRWSRWLDLGKEEDKVSVVLCLIHFSSFMNTFWGFVAHIAWHYRFKVKR